MADDLKLTDRSEQLIKQAINLAENNSVAQVHPLHLACALWEPEVEDGTSTSASAQPSSLFQTSFEKAGLDKQTFSRALLSHTNRLPSVYPAPSPPLPLAQGTHVVLRAAIAAQKEQRDSYVAVDHLLLAILKVAKDVPELRSMFTEAKVDERARKKLEDEIRKARGNRKVDSKSAEEGFESLQKYATDLTALAAEGKLDPVIGRDKEVRRTIAILSRRTKNSAILIGEPGVGKWPLSAC
jgi:ATP-dependent Clp protease ATP-binding subunit ClpB